MPSLQTNENITRTTELEKVDNVLQDCNSTFASLLSRLSTLGHRLRDTNTPQAVGKEAAMSQGKGIIYDIESHLEYYRNHNTTLESVINKFEELI